MANSYSNIWATEKNIIVKNNDNVFHFIGNKHIKPQNQDYLISVNKIHIGKFNSHNNYYSVSLNNGYYDIFDTIDELILILTNSVNSLIF